MFSRLTNKLSGMIIGAVAVLAIVGAGAAMASQNHVGPFASGSHSASSGASQSESSFEAQGVIQQVTFDQGTTQSGNLTFLPDGKQATVTVLFNVQSHIESVSNDEGQDNASDQQATLQAGQHAKVEGTLQADGSVLASEIKVDVDVNGAPTQEPGDGEDGEDQELTGTVQSIDTNGQTFVLLPDNGGAAVTIAYDSQTRIEREDHGTPFAAGAHVKVEVVERADGSLYATEIKTGTDGGDNGQGGSGDGGSGGGSGNAGSGSSDDGGSGH